MNVGVGSRYCNLHSAVALVTLIVFVTINISVICLHAGLKDEENGKKNHTPFSRQRTSVHSALEKLDLPLLKQNQSKASGDCFCPNGRPNWIYYHQYCPSNYNGAGIKDRQNIFRNVLFWADEVCARVAFACSPKVMLNEKRHGCRVPEEATWDEYFVAIRKSIVDGEQKVDLVEGILEPEIDESQFEGMATINTTRDSHGKESTSFEWQNGMTAMESYKLAQQLSTKNETFVWRFGISFWQSDLHFKDFFTEDRYKEGIIPHRAYTDSCGILDVYMTRTQIRVAQILLDFMKVTYVESFVSLHLRRGDHTGCDTNPAVVVDYMNCSLDIEEPNHNIEHVLAFTNGDEEYRRNMTKAFNDGFAPHKDIIFVDDIVESENFLEHLGQVEGLPKNIGSRMLQDNCYRWSVLKVIISTSYFHLERGKASCNECDQGGINPNETVVRW